MKYIILIIFLVSLGCKSPQGGVERSENRTEFDDFITQIENEFIYKSDKQEILDCIKEKYAQDIDTITKPYFKVLYYESILNEFYDSHISLNTNTDQSFRLSSPIYENIFHDDIPVRYHFEKEIRKIVLNSSLID